MSATATAQRGQVTTRQASDAQARAIAANRHRKVITAPAAVLLCSWDDGDRSFGLARLILDYLFDASTPWVPRKPAADPVTEPGMYTDGSKTYRVQAARGGERKLYAKLLVITPVTTSDVDDDGEWVDVPVLDADGRPTYRASFEYAAGAIHRLSSSMRMSQEQARAIGHDYGICCVCSAVLSDPRSVSAGIGPICASRL